MLTGKTANKKKSDDTVRVIVGEIGRDTKTGILGRGYSYDNGKTFHVLDTMYGRLYGDDDINAIWENGTSDRVKREVDSATAEIPSIESTANEAVMRAESAIAASKVNSDAQIAMNSAIAAAYSSIDTVKTNLGSISSNLDTYAKSAAAQGHDITIIKQKQGQFEVDYAGTKGDVNQIKADIKGLSENLKDSEGDITSLQATAKNLQASMSDAQGNVSNLQVTAKKYGRIFEDHSGRLSKVEQTATGTQKTISNQQGQINNLQSSIDGLKSTVASKTNESQFTQLSNLVQSKVSTSDFTSKVSQLSNDINLRVTKGDLISQLNIEAGNMLIQSNKIYLSAGNVVFSDSAFIPSAAIESLDVSKLTFYGPDKTYATIGSSVKQYDDDKQKSTINLQYDGGIEIHSSNELGSILTMHDQSVRLAVKSQVYGSGSGLPVSSQYSGVWFGNNYTLMNTVDKEGNASGISIGAGGDTNNDYCVVLYDGSKNNQTVWGTKVDSQRFDVYTGNANLFIGPDRVEMRGEDHATVHSDNDTYIEGKNSQIHLSDGNVSIGNPSNQSTVGLHVTVQGWGTFSGYVEAMGFTQKSTLSSKTRIQPLDTSKCLATVNVTDIMSFQYKAEVSAGMTKRHVGPIIDDIHDVAKYQTPDAFIAENRQGRSDGDIIGYLMGAIQELSKQLDKVKEKI